MILSGESLVFGIIGGPIGHSVSPAMHNAAFGKLGLNAAYVPFPVKRTQLEKALNGIRALGIRGLNVTIPYKEAIIPFLDSLDVSASDAGAVNTVMNRAGRLTGFNTDGRGFLAALGEAGIKVQGRNVTVIGAGGASRAICFSLVRAGAAVSVLNRTLSRAEKLGSDITRLTGGAIQALPLNEGTLKKALGKSALLVNASSLGMHPHSSISPVPERLLRQDLAVFDIIYNPSPTRLTREAAALGANVISGLEMLVRQGALSFEIWTGRAAPLVTMRRAALEALNQNES